MERPKCFCQKKLSHKHQNHQVLERSYRTQIGTKHLDCLTALDHHSVSNVRTMSNYPKGDNKHPNYFVIEVFVEDKIIYAKKKTFQQVIRILIGVLSSPYPK